MTNQQTTQIEEPKLTLKESLTVLRQHPAVNFAGRLALAYTAGVVLTLAAVGAATVYEANQNMKAELEAGEELSEEDVLVAEFIESVE